MPLEQNPGEQPEASKPKRGKQYQLSEPAVSQTETAKGMLAGEILERRNPEVEAKLQAFKEKNPDLVDRYQKMSHDYLVNKILLAKMQQAERQEAKHREIFDWVKKHDLEAKINDKIRNVPEAHKAKAFIQVATAAAQGHAIRGVITI